MSSRVLYLDLVGGASGDMLLAALVDAGASLQHVRAQVDLLGLPGIVFEEEEAHPAGLRAKRIRVLIGGREGDTSDHAHGHHHDHAHGHHHGHRPYKTIRDLLNRSALVESVRAMALDAFARLASAEGAVHGVDPDEVEFHEVGSDDAIADIVGVCAAIDFLKPDQVTVSPVPIGRGLIQGAHGPIPLPAPATVSLLAGAKLQQTTLEGETVTPTGAALLAVLAQAFGPMPSMTLERVGVGAGKRTWPDRPNVVRAFIGVGESEGHRESEHTIVEANIDDMTPQQVAFLSERLFAAGALDVWSTPIQMKKGRLAVCVAALVGRTIQDSVCEVFFAHSTTLGVRSQVVDRHRVDRQILSVATRFGTVRVKRSHRRSGDVRFAPEYDDCARAAVEHAVPLQDVVDAALAAVPTEEG